MIETATRTHWHRQSTATRHRSDYQLPATRADEAAQQSGHGGEPSRSLKTPTKADPPEVALLLRQLRDVAQDPEERRGEGAVFFFLDAVEQGLEPRVHHRPHP